MRRLTHFAPALVVLALATGSVMAAEPTTPVPATQGIRHNNTGLVAFTNATIVVSPDRTIENATLVVRDGRIESVGAGITVPPGASVTDLGGKRIYPGFIDPYTEYGLRHVGRLNPKKESGPPKYEADRIGANAWNDAIHAERDWVESFKPDREAAKSLMKRGVTVVQSAKMDGILRGRSFVASLAEGLPNEVILVPYGLHWASFDKGTSQQQYPTSLMGSIALVRQALLDARWYQASKEKNGDVPTNLALAAIARNDRPIVFETGDDLSMLRAARISREMNVPFIYVGSNLEYERPDAIRAIGRPIILPLAFPKKPDVGTIEDELDVSLAELRHWEQAPSNPAVLEKNGIRFALTGNGLGEKEDFFGNLRKAIARGLSPRTALAALTTVPAEMLGISDAGTLERGKRANFIVADGDLFESDTAKLEAVWIDGRLAEELVEKPGRDFRGEYEVTIGGQTYTLRLEGEPKKLKGKLVRGETEVELKDVRGSLDNLSFSAPMDDFDVEGVARFSIEDVRSEVSGQVTLPGGMPAGIMVQKKVDRPEPESVEVAAEATVTADAKEEPKAKEREVIVSTITHPNVAYGWREVPKQQNVLVRNATIWTSEAAGVLQNADLLVLNGKIAAIGRELKAPAGIRVIDATGKHVSPGMIDEHSHIAISQGVNESSHAATAEVRIGDVIDPEDVGIYRALAGGTTAAQLLHGSANPIGGQAQVIKLRWGLGPEDLKFEAAPPSIKFALGENVKQSNWGSEFTIRYPQTRMGVQTFIRDRFLAAKSYDEEWKKWNRLSVRERQGKVAPRRDLQLEALAEILNRERFVHSHSYVQSEILALMRTFEEFGINVQTFTHILEGYKVAPEMAKHGAGASTFSDWWAYKFEVYDAIPYNTCIMMKNGVLTSINSDSGELIRRLNQEAAKSVMYCGIEAHEALKLATINPAKQLKIDHRTGSLKEGKDADFVIWSGSPASMYSIAEQTWVDGTPYFTLESDEMLRRQVQQEKQALVQKVLRSDDKGGVKTRDDKKKSETWHCEIGEEAWNAHD